MLQCRFVHFHCSGVLENESKREEERSESVRVRVRVRVRVEIKVGEKGRHMVGGGEGNWENVVWVSVILSGGDGGFEVEMELELE